MKNTARLAFARGITAAILFILVANCAIFTYKYSRDEHAVLWWGFLEVWPPPKVNNPTVTLTSPEYYPPGAKDTVWVSCDKEVWTKLPGRIYRMQKVQCGTDPYPYVSKCNPADIDTFTLVKATQ